MLPISNRSTISSSAYSSSADGRNEPQPSGSNPAVVPTEVNSFASNRVRVGQIMNASGRESRARRRQHPGGESSAGATKKIKLSSPARHFVEEINAAEKWMLKVCQRKRIEVKETLYKTINACPDDKKPQFINTVSCYFGHVDETVIKNTSSLTAMLYSGEKHASTTTRIERMLTVDLDDVKAIAQSPHLKSISSMNHAKGFPDAKVLGDFLALNCLQINGQVVPALLRSISSMCNGQGLPEASAVRNLLSCKALQCHGKVSHELLRSISSMTHGHGIPAKDTLNTLLQMEELKIDGQINAQLLSCISTICYSKGLPDSANVKEVLRLANKYGNGQLPLMKYIAGLYRSKGMPAAQEIERLLLLPSLRSNKRLNLGLLELVSRLHRDQGFPPESVIMDARTALGLGVVNVSDAAADPQDLAFYANLANFVYDDEQPTVSAVVSEHANPEASGTQSGLQEHNHAPLAPAMLAKPGGQFLRGGHGTPTAATGSLPSVSGSRPTTDHQPHFSSFWTELPNLAADSSDPLEQSQGAISRSNERLLSDLAADTLAQPSTSTAIPEEELAALRQHNPEELLAMVMEYIAEQESSAQQ